MSEVILDASALLALMNKEKGADKIIKYFPDVVMSSVNVSEAVTVMVRTGAPVEEIYQHIESLIKEIKSFNDQQAYLAAYIYSKVKRHGLSFGDRACLSLARVMKYPVITTDKAWAKLDLGIDIRVVR